MRNIGTATMVQRPIFHRQNVDSLCSGAPFPMSLTLKAEKPAVNAAGGPFVEFPAGVVELRRQRTQILLHNRRQMKALHIPCGLSAMSVLSLSRRFRTWLDGLSDEPCL